MNRTYRLVWNRALHIVQVASELTHSPDGGNQSVVDARPLGRRHPLALACAAVFALALAGTSLSATAACTPDATHTCGTNGSPGSNGSNGSNGGNGSSGIIYAAGQTQTNTISVTGGIGGIGGFGTSVGGVGGGGGVGGAGVSVSGTGSTLSNGTGGTITGGTGGNGGSDYDGSGGSGGGGGAGVSGTGLTLTNTGVIAGGNGGIGGSGVGGVGGVGGAGVSGTGLAVTNTGGITGGHGGSGGSGNSGAGGVGVVGGAGVSISGTGSTLSNGTGGTITGGNGGNGGIGGSFGGVAGAGGAGVSGTGLAVTNTGGITGGHGGSGGTGYSGYSDGGNGGVGGAGVSVSGTGSTLSNNTGGTITGGGGGNGGSGGGGKGGNGGGGGAGVSGTDSTLSNETGGTITGGNGGNGGYGHYGSGGGGVGGAGVSGTGLAVTNTGGITGGSGGSGGNGGVGGAGVSVSGTGSTLSNYTGGTITGGNGGNGGSGFSVGSLGGNGGAGVGSSGLTLTLTNTGVITGGNGGNGGYGGNNGGRGGAGGAGVGGTGLAVTNTGGITGGHGGGGGNGGLYAGGAGVGGAGVSSTGGSSVTNAGNISGGLAGNGVTRAAAVSFSGGGNTLTLQVGSSETGGIVSTSGATNGGDTLILTDNSSGGGSDSLNVGGVSGFAAYEKAGTSSWTLTGSSTGQNWLLQDGTLQLGDGTNAASLTGVASSATVTAGSGTTLKVMTNAALHGGNGGSTAGVGVSGTGFTLTNSGTISGGLAGDGVTRADAILFSGSGNTLNLQTGATFVGAIELSANSAATIASQDIGMLLSSNILLGDAAALNLDTSAGDLSLSGTLGTGLGDVITSGSDVLALGAVNVASLTANGSALTLNGNVTTTGAQIYDSAVTLGGDVTLSSSNGGALDFASTLNGAHNLTLDSSGVTTLGVVGGTTALSSLTTGNAGSTMLNGNVTTTGTQTYNNAVSLDRDEVLTSTGGGAIDFESHVDNAQSLTVNTGGAAIFADTVGGATALHALTVSSGTFSANALYIGGGLSVITTSGGIAQSGAFTVAGASSFNAGAGAITLNDALNDFTGAVNLTGGNVSLTNNAATLLDNGTVNGTLAVSSNGALTETGALEVTGTSTFNAGSQAISLTNSGNSFGGAVTATGASIAITAVGDLTIAALNDSANGEVSLIAGGDLTVPGQAINTGTGDLTLSAGSTLTTSGNLSGANVSLSDSASLTLNNSVAATTTLTLDSSRGAITQTSGSITASTLTGTSSGSTTLNDLNVITDLGAFTANGFSLTNAQAMTVTGAVNSGTGATSLTTDGATSSLTISGSVSGAGVALTSGGTIDAVAGSRVTSNNGVLTLNGGAFTLDGALNAGTGTATLASTGAITQIAASGVITAGTLTGSSIGSTALGGANAITNLGAFTADGFSLTNTQSLTVIGAVNGGGSAVGLTTNGTSSNLTISGSVSGTGTALTSGGTIDAAAGSSVNSNNGELSLSGRALTLDGSLNAGTGTMALDSTAAITQASTTGVITAGTLTGNSTGNTTLNGNNAIASLDSFASGGSFSLIDTTALTIKGSVSATGIALNDSDGIVLTGSLVGGNAGTTIGSSTSLQVDNSGVISGNVIDHGALVFDQNTNATFSGVISGNGSLVQGGSSTLILDGDSSNFSGDTEVQSGGLIIGSVAGNGAALGGNVTVDNDAMLGGHGSIDGNLDVLTGGHLAPGNSIGTLTISGDATFAHGSQLDYEFGAPGANFTTVGSSDSVNVGGHLTLNGAVLNVTDAGSFGPGLYNLFTYGTLTETNGGITLGNTPAGDLLSIQNLSGDQQINLLNTTGLTLDFWNGNNLASTTQLGGGNGTWSTTATNWTDANVDATTAMQPQPGFAIFGGAPGTVTVDNGAGAVSALGLQFTSSGYTLNGDTLTLVASNGTAPIIRVGDGSAAGTSYTATINNVLAGSDGLTKADYGTLVLAGANTYSGGTTITAGTLQVGNGGTSGSIGNDGIADNGRLVFDRSDAVSYSGVISGSGSLTQQGGGSLTLAGANSYSGGTMLNAGTLAVSADNNLGDASGGLSFGGGALENTDAFTSARNVALTGNGTFQTDADLTESGVISGAGELIKTGTATLTFTSTNTYSGGTTITAGTLQVGNGGTSGSIGNDGVVDSGTLVFDRSDAVSYSGVISGNGSLVQGGSSTLILDGDSSNFSGDTEVQSGGLIIGSVAGNGAALGGNVTVDNDAMLGGHGSIDGNLDVLTGGHLAPGNSIGTLTISGDATFAHGSQLDYELGAPGANFTTVGSSDSVNVGGHLTLNGAVLNVTDAGSFGPGLYNLFTYGTLTETNGGITLGNTPAGDLLSIQNLSGDQQINLLNTTGLTLDFWNGNNLASTTQLGGGNGTWSTTATNWTNANADATTAMQPQPGFAIFGGAPGTVTVDNGAGAVSALGLQFTSSGYTLNGDTLTLVASNGTAPIIRVGDGSAAGTSYTATINNVLAGSDGLTKADYGTLVLTGSNTYSGGTTITGGMLSVSADANLGDAGGALTLDGGTLEVTGTTFNATTRTITLGSAGGGFDIADPSNTFSVGQALSGSGGLSKLGDGTLVLSGANTYTGGTTIISGTLQLGNGGTSGAISGDVGDNGTLLFDRSDAISFAGVISGSGALVKNGSDTLTLSGANSYGGGTAINAGSVAVGNNSALGTGMVVMAAGTTVVFANSSLTLANAFSLNGDPTYTVASGSTDTLGGVIADGSTPGELVLNGGGTLVLAGTNTYSGGTTISAGTLQGDTSSLQGNITDNAALVFKQNSKGTFAGVISGSGELIQGGSGTVILTGANSYSGGTTINAGTLQGNTTSLQGSITDNAALVFNQTTDGSFIGAVSGSGTLSKIGTGLLVLNGNNPLTGSTTVQSGTLEVGDAATPSATLGGNVIVAAGGTLRGYGTIGGNVINSGTLWAGGSIGALTVQGNYIQNVGSLLNLDATPSGGASLLTVGGKATILSGSAVVLAQAGNWAPQTSYAILTAAGSITGQFTSASSSLLFLNPILSYTTNAVNLSLERNDISLASVAQTPNQRAVATGTDNLGFDNPVYSAVTTLDDAATARHAFDQLSGVIHASTSSALIDDSRYVRDAINRHLLGLDNDGIQGSTDDGVSAWTSAWGHGGRNDDDSNVPALQANGSGVLVGADLPLGADARLGGVLGHGQNSIQTNSVGASSNVLGKHAGLYGSGTFGALALRAGAVYSWQDVHTNRTVAFGNLNEWLTSEHDAQTAQAYVEGSYQFNVSPGQRLEPFGNVARVRVHEDALQEGGGAAALAVAGNSVSVNTATLGLRDTLALDAAGGTHAHASLGWRQAWGDLTPIATTRFVDGGDSFAIAGMPVARDALNADLGIDFKIAKNVTVDASYLGQFASKVQDQGARMSLTVTF